MTDQFIYLIHLVCGVSHTGRQKHIIMSILDGKWEVHSFPGSHLLKATSIVEDAPHLSHGLFSLMASGKRYSSIAACTSRMRKRKLLRPGSLTAEQLNMTFHSHGTKCTPARPMPSMHTDLNAHMHSNTAWHPFLPTSTPLWTSPRTITALSQVHYAPSCCLTHFMYIYSIMYTRM